MARRRSACALVPGRQRELLHVSPAGRGTSVALDLRFDTPLANTGLIGATPQAGDLGVAGAQIVVRRDPSRSVLYLRMTSTTTTRMPPPASSVVDSAGAKLVSDWINGL